MDIKINFKNVAVSDADFTERRAATGKILDGMWDGSAENAWVQAPFNVKSDELDFILNVADIMKQEAELMVVIGTDEATLAARAAIEALPNIQDGIPVRFAGHNFCTAQMEDIMNSVSRMGTILCIVSRDGQEPEVQAAFGILKELLEKKYDGQNIEKRIFVVTEAGSQLAEEAAKEGYVTFEHPAKTPMLYGILSPAVLYPMAVAGADVREFIAGAKLMATSPKWDTDGTDYAVARALADESEKITTFDSRLAGLCRWMAGIHGTSYGEGCFETVLSIDSCGEPLMINDGPLKGKSFEELNKAKYEKEVEKLEQTGRKIAAIAMPELDAHKMGQLMYFLQMSSDIAKALGTNFTLN